MILLLLDVPLALVVFLTFPVLAVASIAFRYYATGAYEPGCEKIANVTAYLRGDALGGTRDSRLRAGVAAR